MQVPSYHPIISYLALLWDETPDKEQFYNSIRLEGIATKCKTATFLKGYDEFSQADLTGFIAQRIAPEDRWWLRPDALGEVETDGDAGTLHDLFRYRCDANLFTDMAAPNDVGVAEDAPITPGARAESPDEQGNDEEEIDDNEPTPRRSARTSAKRPIVASPPGQPPTQRPKVDYSEGVSILSVHPS